MDWIKYLIGVYSLNHGPLATFIFWWPLPSPPTFAGLFSFIAYNTYLLEQTAWNAQAKTKIPLQWDMKASFHQTFKSHLEDRTILTVQSITPFPFHPQRILHIDLDRDPTTGKFRPFCRGPFSSNKEVKRTQSAEQ